MKLTVWNPVVNFSDRADSHRSGYAKIQRCMLAASRPEHEVALSHGHTVPDDTDIALFSTPMEYKGVWNLFSGVTPKMLDAFEQLQRLALAGKVVALETPIPDLGQLLIDRKVAVDPEPLREALARVGTADQLYMLKGDFRAALVAGDSHANAAWHGGAGLNRLDSQTMFGALKRGLWETLVPAWWPEGLPVADLTVTLGNIDIRHHLCRQPDPAGAAVDLVAEFGRQIAELFSLGRVRQVTLVEPYPIEFEGRKIPKTGWYNKAPFAGSLAQRDAVRQIVTEGMRQLEADLGRERVATWRWPEAWYAMDPEEYARLCMEKPGSVHLSPRLYRWDLDNNRPRYE